jgi:hypothetical protein
MSASESQGRTADQAHLEADPWADGLYVGMNRGDPLPAGVVDAMADFALKLPPGTSAERLAALMAEPEPEAGL